MFSLISFMNQCCSPQLEADLFDKQDLARAKVAALKVFSTFFFIWVNMAVNFI